MLTLSKLFQPAVPVRRKYGYSYRPRAHPDIGRLFESWHQLEVGWYYLLPGTKGTGPRDMAHYRRYTKEWGLLCGKEIGLHYGLQYDQVETCIKLLKLI